MTDKKELEGLESTTLAVAAQKAAQAGHKGATAESGPWLLTLDYTTYSAIVSFAKNRELRKKMYIAYRRIAADGKTDNTGIIKEILRNRLEMSKLLGFATYADQAFLSKVRGGQASGGLLGVTKGGEGHVRPCLQPPATVRYAQHPYLRALESRGPHLPSAPVVSEQVWEVPQSQGCLAPSSAGV